MAKPSAPKAGKAPSKSEVLNGIAESTGLTRKQVSSVFDELGAVIERNLGKKGPGVFVVPGLMKIRVVRKPATKARMGTNPFTRRELTEEQREAMRVRAEAARAKRSKVAA